MSSRRPPETVWPGNLPHPASTHAASQHDFLWGVSSSAEQHEGGFNGPLQPQTNWAWAEREGRVAPSGEAAGFWTRAEEDFARCREMGLNAFRLGLSWSRIQPGQPAPDRLAPPPRTAPPFDPEALRRYAEILTACQAAGLEPVVTLHHFAHPAWLGLDAWLYPETIDYYLDYVRETALYLLKHLRRDLDGRGGPPRYFITINEPNVLSLCTYLSSAFPSGRRGPRAALRCMAHLLEAHLRARRLLHALYAEHDPLGPAPQVSFNNYCNDLYWFDQGWLDLLFARAQGVPRGRLSAHLREQAGAFEASLLRARIPIRSPLRRWLGEALKRAHHGLARLCAIDESWERLADLVYESPDAPVDFLAIDYYDPFVAHALRWPHWNDEDPLQKTRRRPFRERLFDGMMAKWWDWKVLPEGLDFFLRAVERFHLPVLIAENGMATRSDLERHHPRPDGLRRSDYIRQHLAVVRRMKRDGWPLIGYLHWSLVDNYEWGTYAPRFGLFTTAREPSPGDDAAAAYAEEIAATRLDFSRPDPDFFPRP
ncbi:MAG: family 1 glycosylhydrolase [Verrucomicrobium sp.]|nr:family 1 glycosylhydrolase [Verrucomicrobium sp.]